MTDHQFRVLADLKQVSVLRSVHVLPTMDNKAGHELNALGFATSVGGISIEKGIRITPEGYKKLVLEGRRRNGEELISQGGVQVYEGDGVDHEAERFTQPVKRWNR